MIRNEIIQGKVVVTSNGRQYEGSEVETKRRCERSVVARVRRDKLKKNL